MAHVYRYNFGQARTGFITSTINLYGVSMTMLLNGGSDFTGTFQLDQTGKTNLELVNASNAGRTFLVVERAGIPVWSGLLTSRTYQSQAKSSQIWARSFAGYPEKIIMDETFIPDGFVAEKEDMISIFLRLWSLLQSRDETNIGIELPELIPAGQTASPFGGEVSPSGVTKSIEVQPWESKYFDEVMAEIADGEPGFDWRIVTKKTNFQYRHILQIGYPSFGMAEPKVIFDYPGVIINYFRTESLGESGTNIRGLGAGQGEDKLIVNEVHQDVLDKGFLRWDQDVQFTEVNSLELLSDLTMQEALNRKIPRRRYSAEVLGNKSPEFGTYLPGDSCTLAIRDPMHPTGERINTRIVGWRLTPPSDDSLEKVSLFFVGSDLSG